MIRGIKFVGIPVRNQDVSLKFYTEALGLKVVTDQPFTDTQRWIELLIPGAQTGIALYTPEGHEKRIGEFQSMAFWCDDVFATAKVLKSKGVTFAEEPKNEPGGRSPSSRTPTGISSHFPARSITNDEPGCQKAGHESRNAGIGHCSACRLSEVAKAPA
jgi:catechol 2,3-dioxygenase-like lactoylglutathione lyase family enzyme